jgi:hypothetical protein
MTLSCAPPPWRLARLIMSKGTPSTQWLAVDHKTASTIQYHRFENDRMSISSKMTLYQSTEAQPVCKPR